MSQLKKAVSSSLVNCIGIKKNEKVLVITDKPLRKIGYTFFNAALRLGADVVLTEIKPRTIHGVEPPEHVTNSMKKADVIIIPTSKSLSHTRARREACKIYGARCASLPGITEDIIKRTLIADYLTIAKRTYKLAKLLTNASSVSVTTSVGTNIKFSIKGRKGFADTGITKTPGSFSNLPAGEACISPVEGTANGVIIVDGSIAPIGKLKHFIKLYVVSGYVISIEGKKEAEKLKEILKKYHKTAKNIAEFGIGTNNTAIVTGNILEDEKALNTVHFALGNNKSFGGRISVPLHLDAVLLNPTIKIDNKIITNI